MPTVIDTLITQFKLDDKYSDAAKKAAGATQDLTSHMGAATQKLGGLTQGFIGLTAQIPGLSLVATSIMGISDAMIGAAVSAATMEASLEPLIGVGEVLLAIAAAAVAAEVALVGFGVESYKVYSKMDTMRRSFTGFLGDVKSSDQMMKFLEQYSVGKPFKLGELGDASVQLSQLELSVNKFLPILTTLATVFKKPNETYGQSLENFTEILRRLEGGETGLALGPRGIGRTVSKKILKELGPELFDAKGEFTGTIDQGLELIMKLAEKEKKVAEAFKGGAEAMWADFDDAKEKLEDAFAKGFAPMITRIMETITASLTELSSTGNIEDFGKELKTIFEFVPDQSGLTQGLIHVESLFIRLSVTLNNLATYGEMAADTIQNWLADLSDWLLKPESGMRLRDHKKDDDDFWRHLTGADEADRFEDEWNKRIKEAKTHPEDKILAPETALSAASQIAQQTNVLRQIAFYTQKMAEHLERHAFGGGDLGRIGITPAELGSRAGGKYSGGVHSAIVAGVDAMVNEAISRQISGMMRNNYMSTGR